MLLKKNKTQTDQIESLKVKLNELETEFASKNEMIQTWEAEKDDAIQQRNGMKEELYSYMNSLSELKIHKENLEMEFTSKLRINEEKQKSILFSLEEKDNQVCIFYLICVIELIKSIYFLQLRLTK
jgi:hypothetical protein